MICGFSVFRIFLTGDESVRSLNIVCKLADQCSCLLRFSTRFIHQYGVSGCQLQICELKAKMACSVGKQNF